MDYQDLTSKLVGKLDTWVEHFVTLLPNIVVAVIVIALFVLGARGISSLFGKGLSRVSDNKPIVQVLSKTLRVAIVVAGLFVALGVLNLDKTVTSLLAGVGVIGLALGFAFQDIAANFMSGIIMAIRRPFGVGDLIRTNDFFGTIERIDLRATALRRLTGELVIIPNKQVLQNPIENFFECQGRRVDVEVGVSYGDDLEKAQKTMCQALEGVDARTDERPTEVFFTGFGGSSVDMVGRFWINEDSQAEYLAARSDAVMRVKKSFDEAGITIPFPIRTLDFGIVGGKGLEEVLPQAAQNGSTSRKATGLSTSN